MAIAYRSALRPVLSWHGEIVDVGSLALEAYSSSRRSASARRVAVCTAVDGRGAE